MAGMPVRHTWSESDRLVPRAVVQPAQRVLRHEAAGGIVMLVAAGLAIGWANSPWSQCYVDLWATPLRVELGTLIRLDDLSLQAWVNDALMTVFFLLVGVEIKREVVHGDLRDRRAITLPVLAAVGGMVVPAAIYASLNVGGPGADGWFVFALAGLGVIFVMRRGDVQSLAPYLAVGAFIWLALLESGVHATLAGVALGLLTPAWPLRSPRRFPAETRRVLSGIEEAYYDRVLTDAEFVETEQRIAEVGRLAMYATSPLERLERALSP